MNVLSECVVQFNSKPKSVTPASKPHKKACFQDDFDQSQKSGTSPMNAKMPQSSFGYVKLNKSGPSSDAPSACGQRITGWLTLGYRTIGAAAALISTRTIRRAGAMCLVSCVAAFAAFGCGRGPEEPPPLIITVPSIQFQIWVNGQITPSQGNYIVAINADVNSTTNVNAVQGETPGEPTAQEAQGSPPTYTHWDQEFVYGSSTLGQPNGFLYAYKVLTGAAGATTATFFPIILTTNQFTLIPNGTVGTGSQNVLSITIPLSQISVRGNPKGANPPIISTPVVTQLYVNYITTDTAGTPQDQLGALGLGTVGFTQVVNTSVTSPTTFQIPNFSSATGPSNPNLFIIGGQIIVTP